MAGTNPPLAIKGSFVATTLKGKIPSLYFLLIFTFWVIYFAPLSVIQRGIFS